MPLSDLWRPRGHSHGASHSSSSFDSGSSETSDVDGSESGSSSSSQSENVELSAFRKRQKQTAKARAESLKSRTRKKLAKHAILNPPAHPAERFRHDLQANSDINKVGQHTHTDRLRRLRLLVSYVKAWCAALVGFFQKWAGLIDHTLVIAIVDDTNVKLSEIPAGASKWRMSRVATVMNVVQALVVSYRPDDANAASRNRKTFRVITPMVTLPKADTDTISAQLVMQLICFLGVFSSRYSDFMPSNLFPGLPIQGTLLAFDSLKANIAMLKQFRQAVHVHHQTECQATQIFPLLALVCFLHQLSLARGPILFGFDRFWSAVVRLSHLFESSSFRVEFRLSLCVCWLRMFQSFQSVSFQLELSSGLMNGGASSHSQVAQANAVPPFTMT